LFIAFVVALTGCAPHQEVPPGGHREWGACAAIGGVTGGVIGAGIGMAISYAATHNDTYTVFVATPGTPSQGALQPIPCTLLGSGCATQPGLTAVSVNNDHGKKWLGLLGAIPGSFAGALIGHYLCDPVIGEAAMPPPPPPLAQAPPPPPPRIVKAPPERIVLRGVHFSFNKYDIRPESEPILEAAAVVIRKHQNLRVEVNGYCDIIGSESYNLVLSQKRAEAVRNFLVQQGVPPDRLIARGFGKTHFVASNETDEGRAQNRRVELVPIYSTRG